MTKTTFTIPAGMKHVELHLDGKIIDIGPEVRTIEIIRIAPGGIAGGAAGGGNISVSRESVPLPKIGPLDPAEGK